MSQVLSFVSDLHETNSEWDQYLAYLRRHILLAETLVYNFVNFFSRPQIIFQVNTSRWNLF